MKDQMKIKRGESLKRRIDSAPPRPPPPPPRAIKAAMRPRKAAAAAVRSVTRAEIDRYWRIKKMEEEEHLLAALKAAARLRARALTEEDYRRFEESLMVVMKRADEGKDADVENNKELIVGIKDWWTKSKYAYLNQPATRSMGDEAAATSKAKCATSSTYFPHMICSYLSAPAFSLTASLGVF